MRRGAEFSIKLGTNELMNSRLSGSESRTRDARRQEAGGDQEAAFADRWLGMGFTLRAALAALEPGRGLWWPNWCRPWWLGARADGGDFWRLLKRSARAH